MVRRVKRYWFEIFFAIAVIWLAAVYWPRVPISPLPADEYQYVLISTLGGGQSLTSSYAFDQCQLAKAQLEQQGGTGACVPLPFHPPKHPGETP